MRLLLDTHTYLWFIAGDMRLSVAARQMIESQSNMKVVSIASLWEIAIKYSLGKLALVGSYEDVIDKHLTINGIGVMDIGRSHLSELTRLPLHHRDPFDRLIIAQSITEQLPIVGTDTSFDNYSIQRLW